MALKPIREGHMDRMDVGCGIWPGNSAAFPSRNKYNSRPGVPLRGYVDSGYTDVGYYDSYSDWWFGNDSSWSDWSYSDRWIGDTDANSLVKKLAIGKKLKNLESIILESLTKVPKKGTYYWRSDSSPYCDTVSYHDYPGYYDKP